MLKRASILGSLVILLGLALYVGLFPPRKIQGTELASCPMVLAGLPGTQLGLEQTVLDDLDPDDYLVRRYDRPDGRPIWLVIVYFQNARLGAHDPQLCYRSQGYKVTTLPSKKVATALEPIPCNYFLATKGGRRELVLYFWYTAGGKALAEVKGWRDSMFFQGLKSNRSFGAFVRISTTEEDDPPEDVAALEGILKDLAPKLPGFFPEDGRKREDR